MKKIISRSMASIAACALVGIIATGCSTPLATRALIKNNRIVDPPVESYLAAYADGNSVVLEYKVKDITKDRQKRVADQYWARLHLDKLDDHTIDGDYSVHRHPLPEGKRKAMKSLSIVDLRKHVAPAPDGYIKFDSIFKFIGQHDSDPLPQVYICMGHSSEIYIRYPDPIRDYVATYSMPPRGGFMPLKNIPLVVVCYPFALARDIVVATFFYALTPSWN